MESSFSSQQQQPSFQADLAGGEGDASGSDVYSSRPAYNREKYLAEEFRRGGDVPAAGGQSRAS